jgi:hypothetical protein
MTIYKMYICSAKIRKCRSLRLERSLAGIGEEKNTDNENLWKSAT